MAGGPTNVAAHKAHDYTANFSTLQHDRMAYSPPLPPLFKAQRLEVTRGPATTAEDNAEAIAALFPHIYGSPNLTLVPSAASTLNGDAHAPIKLGLVLSGGQAAGGHNVISGIFDYLKQRRPGSTIYGFKGGPSGIVDCDYSIITDELLLPYRNQGGFDIICSGRTKIETPAQFEAAMATCTKLGLAGLVVIGGDDSNTNAALLAERFEANGMTTKVVGVPKTIDGDLKTKEIATSFGFDTACKIYSEMIGNVMIDARSATKYYHFVRLMGRAASHITLEAALQTHPQVALIGEEVAAQAQTLSQVTAHIADVVCARAGAGRNYGVVLIPEGLIDFIPEVSALIAELNEILAGGDHPNPVTVAPKLTGSSQALFESLPMAIREQLLLDRDPHGNVQVAKIETEKLLIHTVEEELARRKAAGAAWAKAVKFAAVSHFFGYEGRCGLPSNFDSNYCYALGHAAAALVEAGATGVCATITNLHRPVAEWGVGGTVLTSMMDVERRAGKNKPVIKKALVDLDGSPFAALKEMREHWAQHDCYRSPGPIQFFGPSADATNFTLDYEANGYETHQE